MKILKCISTIIGIIIVLALTVLFINDKVNEKVFVTEYKYKHVEIPKAFNGYKILMISDIHEAPFSEQIIAHINEISPDLVLFTGDMALLPDHSIDETIRIAQAIKDIPMYGISGNHETQCGYYDEIFDSLRDNGIVPLENDSIFIEKDGDSILLLGVKDPQSNDVSSEKIKEIQYRTEDVIPDDPCFAVMLLHRADMYPEMKYTGVDLILSGHLHGGVVRLPFLGGIAGHHNDMWFPDYDYGLFDDGDGADMIVSGGCDKNSQKRRIFNPPEIVLITLEKAE